MKSFLDNLPSDLVSEIYTYDSTYREVFRKILRKTFENEEVQILKKFLEMRIIFPSTYLTDWLTIRQFGYKRRRYFDVVYPDDKFIFHIISHREKVRIFDAMNYNANKLHECMMYDVVQERTGRTYESVSYESQDHVECWYTFQNKTYIILGYRV